MKPKMTAMISSSKKPGMDLSCVEESIDGVLGIRRDQKHLGSTAPKKPSDLVGGKNINAGSARRRLSSPLE
ncbi:hypothetical protein [Roseimaritima sediminicola]|uniref:hypothetical protein n=1 Tax=Roseimaritima sediminicola TaxID=2662066 RepID=UPI0012982483|nr:hypothetical protein [Roseimaritima sediminicola]